MNVVNSVIGTDLPRAAQLLQQGKLVAIPTETVYGLAADALNAAAVAGIFAAKNRPTFDPLIVHIASQAWLPRIVSQVPALSRQLMDAFWPGPLTIVLEKSPQVADLVTSGLPTVAVRMPAHPLALELLELCNCPLAAPSANLFGRTSPTTAAHVAEQLAERIDYILDGGPCAVGIESTIVRTVDSRIQILRPGGISREQLAEFGEVETWDGSSAEQEGATVVPGQLKEHYAPQTPLQLLEDLTLPRSGPEIGLLTLQLSQLPVEWQTAEFGYLRELSASGDLREAATRFFAALHELDAAGIKQIFATPFPAQGLGVALNDRLQRAAHG